MRTVNSSFKTMAADGLTITEQWIRDKLNLQHSCLADIRSLTLNSLVTVQGIEHLEMLERLNLYYNRLASLQNVFSLHKLQNLKDLDLRLNPVVKKHPHYRLYLVHAMTNDDCPVQDRERKAALMHFSSEANLDTNHKNNTRHNTQEALNEQMKNVLEENNVSLQKQLIKAENKLLSSRLKKMPNMQDRGQQTVPEELNVKRRTIREGNGAAGELQVFDWQK